MADTQKRAKKSKKGRKHGRNVPFCKAYAARRQGEHNHLARLAAYLRHDRPNRVGAFAAFSRLWQLLKGRPATESDLAGYRA